MTESTTSAETPSSVNDLAYLRSLAEAGKDAPLSAGPYLVAGGGWFAAASAVIGSAELALIPFGRDEVMPASMLGACVGFAATLALLLRRDARSTETNTNKAVGAAWTAAGFGIFSYFLAVQIASWRMGSPELLNSIMLVVLLLYGAAWFVTAQVAGRRWMYGVALLTAISLFGVAATLATPAAWLAYAGALVMSGVLPGVYLMHLARAIRG
jgi:hypothetical protein